MWLQKVGMKGRQFFMLLGVIVVLQSCMKNDEDPYDGFAILQQDIQTIQTYLDANGIDAEMDSSTGVFFEIHKNGSGYKTVINADVEIQFEGETLDGEQFANTSSSGPVIVSLGPENSISGITDGLLIGLIGAKEGDSLTIYAPSPFGYKNQSYLNVPPNSILVYHSKLYKIENLEEDYADIDEYVTENNWTASIEPEYGIRYVVHKPGDQDVKAEYGDGISVHYQGELFNRTVFDSSVGKSPLDFTLGSSSLISGFEAGVSQLHEQDSATILIPSVYAYGKSGSGTIIPANTALRFGLDVQSITKPVQ